MVVTDAVLLDESLELVYYLWQCQSVPVYDSLNIVEDLTTNGVDRHDGAVRLELSPVLRLSLDEKLDRVKQPRPRLVENGLLPVCSRACCSPRRYEGRDLCSWHRDLPEIRDGLCQLTHWILHVSPS